MDDGRESMAGPRLTFAIPYFRGLDYLREAIDSVVAQDLDAWELLVIDDHAAEPADLLVGSYDDSRISYMRNERNLGLARNWNECLRFATAPLVTILHADDRLLPAYAATVVAAADAHPDVAAVFTDAFNVDEHGARTRTMADFVKGHLPRPSHDHLLGGDEGLAGLLRGNYIICPSLCFRRAVVGSAPFRTDLRFVPDWELTTRLLLDGLSLYAVRAPLIEYRRHSDTETSLQTSDSSRFVEEFDLLRQRAAECTSRGLGRSARTARWRVTVRGHLIARVLIDAVNGRGSIAREECRMLWSDLRGGDRVQADHSNP